MLDNGGDERPRGVRLPYDVPYTLESSWHTNAFAPQEENPNDFRVP
jgi:hypothetical protein